MKVTDIIFSLICGRVVGFLLNDFFKEWGIHVGFYHMLIIWVALPFIALLFLWFAHLIGRKLLFVYQAAKHLLVGAFATVIDLKLFEGLVWALAFFISLNPIVSKAVSFLISTSIKYMGNKYWAFQKHEKENLREEIYQFFIITLVGLVVDVGVFYYATSIVGPPAGVSSAIWTKLAVIFAALAAALWNFLGYKFFVFKK